MSFMKVTITESGATPRNMLKTLRQVKKRGFMAMGTQWHRKMRPQHFTRAAYAKYGYKRRTPAHEKLKEKMYGHRRPLVFSGESEQLSRIRDVRATAKGARVVMRVPRLNIRRSANSPNMREEMTRIAIKERDRLVAGFAKSLENQWNSMPGQRRKVIAG